MIKIILVNAYRNINIKQELEKWNIKDKKSIEELENKYKEIQPHTEEHYKMLIEAINMKLDTYNNIQDKKAYFNAQKARYMHMKSLNIYALFTSFIGFFSGIFPYSTGIDKIIALCMMAVLSIAALSIYLIKDCTPKYNFYLLLLEDVEKNYEFKNKKLEGQEKI